MKQINSFTITDLLIGPHYEFHTRTVDMIEKTTPAVLKVESFFPPYKANVEEEFKHLNSLWRLPFTERIAKFDRIRDIMLQQFFATVKNYLRHDDENFRDTGEVLWRVISPYEGLWNYEINKQTAKMKSLFAELEHPDITGYVEVAFSKAFIGYLKGANEDVEVSMNYRLEELAKTEHVDLKNLRDSTNAMYRRIRQRINSVADLSPTEKVEAFIDEHNALVYEFKHVISGMRRGGSGNEKLPPRPEEEERPE